MTVKRLPAVDLSEMAIELAIGQLAGSVGPITLVASTALADEAKHMCMGMNLTLAIVPAEMLSQPLAWAVVVGRDVCWCDGNFDMPVA